MGVGTAEFSCGSWEMMINGATHASTPSLQGHKQKPDSVKCKYCISQEVTPSLQTMFRAGISVVTSAGLFNVLSDLLFLDDVRGDSTSRSYRLGPPPANSLLWNWSSGYWYTMSDSMLMSQALHKQYHNGAGWDCRLERQSCTWNKFLFLRMNHWPFLDGKDPV